MNAEVGVAALVSFAAAAALTGIARKIALSFGVVDVPNHRSSHVTPVPRGGGSAIVIATTAVLCPLALLDRVDRGLLWAIAVGGAAVAGIGLLDDHRRVSPVTRLLVHIAAASWAVAWLGGMPPLQIGQQVLHLFWVGDVFAVLGIVWALNLFNFMDGIDGIAASEAVFMTLAAALVSTYASAPSGTVMPALIFGAACVGFLVWNWPPAKIFMGDVGSGYLGYVLAVLGLAAAREHVAMLFVWLILGGVFVVDATVTLLRRLIRRERVYEAHRSHAYQILARRWGSHRRVTILVLSINVTWLLPCALLARTYPEQGAAIVVGALAPLAVAALLLGAGAAERASAP